MLRSAFLLLIVAAFTSSAGEAIRLPNNPALSPDGKTLAFDWGGDVWTVPIEGGVARPLTSNTAKDTAPKFSPDGKEIAFVSDREGSPQIFVMPASGGTPTQMTFHTAGYALYEWTPDGKGWLVGTQRDHGWGRRGNDRLQIVHRWQDTAQRRADELVFDDYGQSGALAPDGKTVLFTREGMEWWRKGYTGSASAQLWKYELAGKSFSRLPTGDFDSRWPMWGKNGAVYYANCSNGVFNIWEATPDGARPLTHFTEDSCVFPCISRDGSTIVFRNQFDLYRLAPGHNGTPQKIEITRDDDRGKERIDRRVFTAATAAAFTSDGLDIAMIVGGDLWVMDTELKEPRRVTRTAAEEREPVFSADGQWLYFVSDMEGKPEIFRARREGRRPWFLTEQFVTERMTNDGTEKSDLSFSPDGSKFAYVRGRGDLVVADANGQNAKLAVKSWNQPQYDWSPDGKWLVYALSDDDFNRDVWIKPLDDHRPPFNLSRHPYNESSPVWSPDGKLIAFVGVRDRKDATDILYVWLREQDDEKSTRDRTIEKALEKYQKGKGPLPAKKDPKAGEGGNPDGGSAPAKKENSASAKKESVEVAIDFHDIHERIRRITIANSNEGNLLWSPDAKRLAFSGTIDGQAGTYTIEVGESARPSLLNAATGANARWLKNGSIVWLSRGVPASIAGTASAAPAAVAPASGPGRGPRGAGGPATGAGPTTPGGYTFTVYQDVDLGKKHQAAFDMAWRTMRDNWYDERMNNRDWDKVRDKYRAMADTPDVETLTTVIQLMLGELNGSHLGFIASPGGIAPRRPGGPQPDEPTSERNWRPATMHLGVRFELDFKGPGLKVRDVLPNSPADEKKSQIKAGEIIVSIDGVAVDAAMDLTNVLNSTPGREFKIKVKDAGGQERDVALRPISYTAARQLLYPKWLKYNRSAVEKLSNGTLGYLHVSAMDMPNFRKFEEELYNAGAGKDGLVIDVRDNGGGNTADHLLTALTQPRHAIAVGRGGGPGYPQDRTVYATWDKPIIVLCNQNSFSNAEIFSHAIKTLKRGKVVGVPTAGGVISTGGTSIMDVGFLRLPFRGWYLIDSGEDMERHGAVPDVIVWPHPGDAPAGKDAQIEKAVELLLQDAKAWKARPQPKLNKASERR